MENIYEMFWKMRIMSLKEWHDIAMSSFANKQNSNFRLYASNVSHWQ